MIRVSQRFLLVFLALCFAPFWVNTVAGVEPKGRIAKIGFLGQGAVGDRETGNDIFLKELRKLGYLEGDNVVIEAQWARGRVDRLPALARELVKRDVDLIVTAGTPAAIAARDATSSTPVVAVGMADPIRTGLAQSLSRPGGNLTGTSMGYGDELSGKWLELIQEAVPGLGTLAVIANPDNQVLRRLKKDIEHNAAKRGLKVALIDVRSPEGLDNALNRARQSAQGALVLGDAVTLGHKREIAGLAVASRLPVLYNVRAFVDEGGLMAYAPDVEVQWQRAAEYVDKILKGAKAGDLPIEQPSRFRLTVNLRTAKAIGVVFPESILLRADDVIQ